MRPNSATQSFQVRPVMAGRATLIEKEMEFLCDESIGERQRGRKGSITPKSQKKSVLKPDTKCSSLRKTRSNRKTTDENEPNLRRLLNLRQAMEQEEIAKNAQNSLKITSGSSTIKHKVHDTVSKTN